MCKNGANLAFHACLQQNGVTALTPENAERKLTKKKMPPSDCINCCTRKFGMNSINHHFSFRDSSWLLVINWFVIESMHNLQTQRVVYDWNHYFGFRSETKTQVVTALTPENAERKLTKKKCHHLTALIVAPVNSEWIASIITSASEIHLGCS